MKHRWFQPKSMSGTYECSTCRIFRHTPDLSPCLAARHGSREINALYRARRKAAEAADGSGFSAIKGWGTLEEIEEELRRRDPDGDWRYEGNLHDGEGWRVRRAVTSDGATQ